MSYFDEGVSNVHDQRKIFGWTKFLLSRGQKKVSAGESIHKNQYFSVLFAVACVLLVYLPDLTTSGLSVVTLVIFWFYLCKGDPGENRF